MLPQYAAQSTAIVCNEVPKAIGDFYRLYIVLLFSKKPIVTGSFSVQNLPVMFDMLAIFAGSRQVLAEKPQAVFDVCPSPPLIWSEFGADNLIELARARVPAQLISMPLGRSGGTSHLAWFGCPTCRRELERDCHSPACQSGCSHRLGWRAGNFRYAAWHHTDGSHRDRHDRCSLCPGRKILEPTHPCLPGCIRCQNRGCPGRIGKRNFGHDRGAGRHQHDLRGRYAGLSWLAKARKNWSSMPKGSPWPNDFWPGSRFGPRHWQPLSSKGSTFKGDFLKQKITRELFSKEQHLPSSVIDRDSIRGWQASGSLDTFARAKMRTRELLAAYERPRYTPEQERELRTMVENLARKAGMDALPQVE